MRRVLIANRGEIAVRIARTCRDMGLTSIAVYSEPDADALHVAACDEAVAIGGDSPATSYLVIEAILRAAASSDADAVHPGFGFLAENADFARAVIEAGLIWVGPSPEAIAGMGDKIAAKQTMAAAGVPVLPGLVVDADVDPDVVAESVGYPLIVKAAAGGGGKGMRLVREPAHLDDAITSARREAASAFGDDRVFLERYVDEPRHIEVQVLGESDGTVLHLYERECSIQRRHQKVVEEAPAPTLPGAVRDQLTTAAVKAAEAIEYRGAGTVEFVVDDAALRAGRDDAAYFLEMNTRLQVEHPVTEEVTGLDLVRLQLLVADGRPTGLSQDDIAVNGAAIEVRLYAENPAADYLPATGTLGGFRPDDSIRWETGVREGDAISTFYDPMLAKAIAWAPTRHEAAARLRRGLERTVVQGVVTNRDLLVHILDDPEFLDGATTTHFLEQRYPTAEARTFSPPEDLGRQAAVVAAATRLLGTEPPAGMPAVPVGFSSAPLGPTETTYTVGGRDLTVAHHWARGHHVIAVDDQHYDVTVMQDHGDGRVRLRLDDRVLTATVHQFHDSIQVVLPAGNVTLFEHPRFPRAQGSAEPGATVAPMPGSVIAVAVAAGDVVAAGDPLVTVEAMKMEHRITAPFDGTVASVRVEVGQQVDAGDVLVVVDAGDDDS